MPVPKRKHSKSRVRIKRNSHYFRAVVQTIKCPKCGAQKRPHTVCAECGN